MCKEAERKQTDRRLVVAGENFDYFIIVTWAGFIKKTKYGVD
jgi:hypothetical protein